MEFVLFMVMLGTFLLMVLTEEPRWIVLMGVFLVIILL